MGTEKVKIKLELFATMWDKPPHVKILLDGNSHFEGDIKGSEDEPDIIEFENELTEGNEYELTIERSGKTKTQTVINDKGDILKDQLLNIKRIEIDEIDIGALVYDGEYTPIYPEPWATQQRESGQDLKDSFKNVTKMGFNGTWRFKFTSPFYMWLLENLY
jgi:hypothetical protein